AYLEKVIELVRASEPTLPVRDEAVEAAVQRVKAEFPDLGFETFLRVGMPEVYRREAELRAKSTGLATVRGQAIRTTQTYCGGARPPKGMELSRREPESGKRILVRRGSENTASEVLAEATSDAAGAFVLSLPAGTYCLVEEAKRALTPTGPTPALVDAGCLENWHRTCDAVVEVPASGEVPVTLDFYKGCNARCYEGPAVP
ncbi:hypothetical protein, partial [Archangium sp.]|uniref:hypothetical protein n=1 Tax=Archangium sp. TaxID=1872627 RepID=UPI002EDB49E3